MDCCEDEIHPRQRSNSAFLGISGESLRLIGCEWLGGNGQGQLGELRDGEANGGTRTSYRRWKIHWER